MHLFLSVCLHALCIYSLPSFLPIFYLNSLHKSSFSYSRLEMATFFFFLSIGFPLCLPSISLVVEQVFHRIPHNPSVGRQVQQSTNQCQQLPREEHLREARLVE